MKKTQRKLCIRYMRSQTGACLSMFIVALLAVMAYLGINDTAQAMRNNIERFWDETGYRDIEIAAPMLLSEDDMAAIRNTEGVTAVVPVWSTAVYSVSENVTDFDVVSITDSINTVILTQGRMPEAPNECLLEQPVLEALGLSVGDSFEVGGSEDLSCRRFVICGVAQHADHACLPIQVPGKRYMMVPKEAFDHDRLQGRCMKAVLRVDTAGFGNRFSAEYQKRTAAVRDRLLLLSLRNARGQLSVDPDTISMDTILNLVMSGQEEIRPWLVMDVWSSMYSYAIRTAVDNVADIGKTFAVMFILVGALVIYASIHRMVEEDKRRIGTAKAMGMTQREIAMRYLAAGLLPTVAGMLAGTLAGFGILQPIMLLIYGRFYVYGMGYPAFLPGATALVFIAGLLIAAAAAFIACIGLIRKPALSLLSDRAWFEKNTHTSAGGGAGKRHRKKPRSKYSLYMRMIVRQIRREKSRVAVIAVSIAGCMVLLVTGFSIKFAITTSIDRQFSQVERYDMKVRFDVNDETGEQSPEQEIVKILEAAGLQEGAETNGWIGILQRECMYYAEERMNGGEMICARPTYIDAFFAARDHRSGETFGRAQADGAYIPLRMSETGNMEPGDPVILLDSRMQLRIVPAGGVYDHYVGGQILMSPELYEQIYREKVVNNCILIRCGSDTRKAIREKLKDLSVTVTETSDAKGEYMRYTSALNGVAGMLAGIAALMAGGVLINLLYLQYYRKKSSLVIMRINGFTPAETAGYVLGESVVTHLVGIVLGIFGGTWLSRYILRLMEGRQFHIIRSPQPVAWLIGGLILLIFSAVIHAIIVKAVVNLKPSEDVLIR